MAGQEVAQTFEGVRDAMGEHLATNAEVAEFGVLAVKKLATDAVQTANDTFYGFAEQARVRLFKYGLEKYPYGEMPSLKFAGFALAFNGLQTILNKHEQQLTDGNT